MTKRLIELLGDRGVAVCDGAMGTMLYSRGVFVNRSFDELNLSSPDLVRSVHQEYVDAGADLIETNTFSANRFKLAAHGCEELVGQINREGVRLAREAAGGRVLVAGSVGPLGVRIEPWGPVALEEARAAFREQIEALLVESGGVDLLILETFYHLPELEQAVLAAREALAARGREAPVVAQVTVTDEGSTPEGILPRDFGRTIASWGVDALGVNCGTGPAATLEAIEELRDRLELPLAAQPNAGAPRNVHGRNMYLTSPEYMASYARRFVKAGVRLIGGCCGTTPAHIRAMKEAVVAASPSVRPPRRAGAVAAEPAPAAPQSAPRSLLAQRLAEGAFPLCAQVRSPRGCDPGEVLERVGALQAGGVDLISVAEGRGGARMSPFAIAQICQRQTGIEAVVELACRHRTLLRMQSEVLGAYALGLKNLVAVTGPPLVLGEYPDATADFEVDSIGLTNMVHRLNEGRDVAGQSIGAATSIHLGVHLDPFAIDPGYEVRRFEWKVEAGAEYALTPPVVDVEDFTTFLPKVAHCRIPILATVPLITSYRELERLRQHGAGKASQELLDRLLRAEREGRELEVGLAIAVETAKALRPHVDGLQLVAPKERLADVLEVAKAVRG
ncbi:MAG: bifunctional homocysteine S-methyltransferase/methylenetetrahydrofolate reductase [Planctomycetota bacterium]